MYKQIVGNLFDSDAKYLVHQTNCVSNGRAAGLAQILFDKYPYADCYNDRVYHSKPGTIDIRGNGKDQRFIVNLMGQYYPGSIMENSELDSSIKRLSYFNTGLVNLSKINNLHSVAFPAGIGCAIAGGDWNKYLKNIKLFHDHINEHQKTDVFIYCLPSNVNQFSFKEN